MVHCCKLMGTDRTKENRFHLKDLGGNKYCNTKKMA